jgi:hypothetical protein
LGYGNEELSVLSLRIMKPSLTLLPVFVLMLFSCGPRQDSGTVMDKSQAPVKVGDSVSLFPETEPEKEAVPEMKPGKNIPVRNIALEPIPATLSAAEKSWVGTLVATVSRDHLSHGGVTLFTGGGKDLVEGVSDAMEKTPEGQDHCIWLELYDDHTGFWYTCSMFGDATVTDKVDPFTGNHITTGLRFQWLLVGSVLKVRLEEQLQFTYRDKEGPQNLKTEYWNLKLPSERSLENFSAGDFFPEYEYSLPKKTKWEFYKKHLFGRPEKYEVLRMF